MGGLRHAEREGTPAERCPLFFPSLLLRETRARPSLSTPAAAPDPDKVALPPPHLQEGSSLELLSPPPFFLSRSFGEPRGSAERGGCCERRGWVPTRSISALTVWNKNRVLLTHLGSCDMFSAGGAADTAKGGHGAPPPITCVSAQQ